MEHLKKTLQESAPSGQLPCAMAFKIAREQNCTIEEIGKLCNELKIKIVSCQLGCF